MSKMKREELDRRIKNAYFDYKAGMTYKKISIKYNVHLGTVKNWKTRHWNKFEKQRIKPRKTKLVVNEPEKKTAETTAETTTETNTKTNTETNVCDEVVKNSMQPIEPPKPDLTENAEVDENLLKLHNHVLHQYNKIANADIGDYCEWSYKEEIVYDETGLTEISREYTPIFKWLPSADVDTSMIKKVSVNKNGFSIELFDKMEALKRIESSLGTSKDAHTVSIEERKLELEREKLELDKRKANLDFDKEVNISFIDDIPQPAEQLEKPNQTGGGLPKLEEVHINERKHE